MHRKWRERKERESKGESGPKEKKKVDKDTRNRMMDKVLRCQNCRWELSNMITRLIQRCSVFRSNISGTTWTPRSGNAATGMDSVGIALTRRTREEERTSWRLGRTAFSGDGEKMKQSRYIDVLMWYCCCLHLNGIQISVKRVLTNVGILRNKGLDSLRRIIESDNNEDTLWLCTRDDDDRESVTLTEKTGNVEQEETFWRFKKKEGTKPMASMEDPTALVPKTMSQIQIEDTNEADDEELKKRYEDDLQKKIKTIDFFETSTSMNKGNISGYGDYNSNNRCYCWLQLQAQC